MNKTSWTIIIVTCLAISALGYFMLYPTGKDCWKNYGEIKKEKEALDEVSQRKQILSDLEKRGQLQNLYDNASKYIPEEAKSGELIIEISAMAQQSDLKIEQIYFENIEKSSPQEGNDTQTQTKSTTTSSANKTPPPASEIGFTFKLGGTFPDFLNFIKSTEASSRLLNIVGLSLTQSKEEFGAQISGKAYWKKKQNLPITLANIKISPETIEKFENLKTFGTPINLPTESGFGRSNPFENY